MGADEYHPISGQGSNLSSAGGIGYTIVDAIDSMLLMGLDAEYSRARRWVEDELMFDREGNFNTFEVRLIPRLHGPTLIMGRLPFGCLVVCCLLTI